MEIKQHKETNAFIPKDELKEIIIGYLIDAGVIGDPKCEITIRDRQIDEGDSSYPHYIFQGIEVTIEEHE